MVDELRQMPTLPATSAADADKWNDFLRRMRESQPALLLFSHAMLEVPVGMQPTIVRALQLLASGRTADGRTVEAVDLAPIVDALGHAAHSFSDSRAPMLSILATLGPRAAPADRSVLAMLDEDRLDDDVRIGIANVLGAIGPTARDTLPALQRLYQESKGEVRNAARAAYAKIAGSGQNLVNPIPGGMLLLPGYTHVPERGTDSWVGYIRKDGADLRIGYDVGGMAGNKADGLEGSKTQLINGHRAHLVMLRGGYLIVTFDRDSANFEAYPIRTQGDLTDVMLMLSTYTFESLPAKYAPEHFKVRLDTSKGPIVIAVHRDWAWFGAQRFFELVTQGYYDGARFFRIRKGTWAQFGIAADPKVAQRWRSKTIRDDPFEGVSNKRGTVAFAFKDPNGRTTQVFINLKDNSATHDKEPFVVFGEVVEGMNVADALYAEYGEDAGGGIRAGKQDPVFEGGNVYLKEKFPLLDYIKTARVRDR
jgi:cyclophilin family peptidyl-prolyl cis-trans isomerase